MLKNCLGENAKVGNVKELALELKEIMKVEWNRREDTKDGMFEVAENWKMCNLEKVQG